MQKDEHITRAQSKFLRSFARHPLGPPAEEWPSPVVLRRWLRRPGFCRSMNSIMRALRYQADFHLTAAAASGANLLHSAVQRGDVENARKSVESLIGLLRMAHIRNRYAEPLPQPERPGMDLIGILRAAHPDISVREALQCFDILEAEPGKTHEPGYGHAIWARTGHPMPPFERYEPPNEANLYNYD